jgi:hypothetical protein
MRRAFWVLVTTLRLTRLQVAFQKEEEEFNAG